MRIALCLSCFTTATFTSFHSLQTFYLPVNAVSVSGADVLTLLLTSRLFAIAKLLVCLSVDTFQTHIFVLSSVSTSVLYVNVNCNTALGWFHSVYT